MLVQEFGHLGRRAFKRIANAFPGGFSSAAIKKHVLRLNLELPSSGNRKHHLDDLDSIGTNVAGGKGNHGETDRKRGRNAHSMLEDQVDGCDSSADDDVPCVPATKRRRGWAHHLKRHKPGVNQEAGGSCGQTVPCASADSALQDDVEEGANMGPRALVSSDDDWDERALVPEGMQSSSQGKNGVEMREVQLLGSPVSASKAEKPSVNQKKTRVVEHQQAASNMLDETDNVAASAQHSKRNGRSLNLTSYGPRSDRLGKMGTQDDGRSVSELDIQAVSNAAHHIMDDLKNDGARFCNDAGCHAKLDVMFLRPNCYITIASEFMLATF